MVEICGLWKVLRGWFMFQVVLQSNLFVTDLDLANDWWLTKMFPAQKSET